MHFRYRTVLPVALVILGLMTGNACARGRVLDANGVALTDAALAATGLTFQLDAYLADDATAQLTLDAELQNAAQQVLTSVLAGQSHLNVSVVIMDKQGCVLAMCQTPSQSPDDLPLALSMRASPGRTLMPLTGLAALADGAVDLKETISDQGAFDLYEKSNATHCWVAPKYDRHTDMTIVEALKNCCDYYFFTVTSRIGNAKWAAMAKALGLDGFSGIGLPSETPSIIASQKTLYDLDLPMEQQATPIAAQVKADLIQQLRKVGQNIQIEPADEALSSCAEAIMRMAAVKNQSDWIAAIRAITIEQLGYPEEALMIDETVTPLYLSLNEIRWGGAESIQAGIGNSFTQVTPIAMARYFTALANGGLVYPARLVEGTLSESGDRRTGFDAPAPVVDLTELIGPYLPTIREAMHGVLSVKGQPFKYYRDFRYTDRIASISARAETPDPDVPLGSWSVGFAPYDDPQITLVVFANSPDAEKWTLPIFRDVMGFYLDRLLKR